jgi:glutathione S-transferase
MITAHHLSQSHSHVVLWLLEELGVDYKIVHHTREKTGRSPDSLRAVHPLGKAPTIEDQGTPMVESTGILLYILETYGQGKLRPAPGTPEAMQFYQWITYVEGSAAAQSRALRQARGASDTPVVANYLSPLRFLNDALEGQDYLVKGMFTAADIQLTFLEEGLEVGDRIARYPNLKSHLARMRARDGYKRAEAKGGPVALGELFRSMGRG